MNIKGKVAVVTGATGGLGWTICQALAAKGAKLCMVYGQSKAKAEAQLAELESTGCQGIITQADISCQAGIDSMYQAAQEAFGGFDILILDAAYNQPIPFSDLESLTHEVWNKIIDFNLTSQFLAARSAAPFLKASGNGRIVTVSSVGGNLPASSSIAYSVSKAGLQHLSRCLSVALAPDVLVNDVAPGLIEGTLMTSKLRPEHYEKSMNSAALKKAATKEDIADAVVMFVQSDSITGQSLVIDCGRCFK